MLKNYTPLLSEISNHLPKMGRADDWVLECQLLAKVLPSEEAIGQMGYQKRFGESILEKRVEIRNEIRAMQEQVYNLEKAYGDFLNADRLQETIREAEHFLKEYVPKGESNPTQLKQILDILENKISQLDQAQIEIGNHVSVVYTDLATGQQIYPSLSLEDQLQVVKGNPTAYSPDLKERILAARVSYGQTYLDS